jgi:hypothetical protein
MSGWARKRVEIEGLRHIKVCGRKDTYCGHPRKGGMFNFGNGEMAVIHDHAPCSYEWRSDASHSVYHGYVSRSVALLQRSLDGGETWPEEENVVVFDQTAPLSARQEFLSGEGKKRKEMDMSQKESIFYFGTTPAGRGEPDVARQPMPVAPPMVCFALRSSDKGRTWEDAPYVMRPPDLHDYIAFHNSPVARMPDGSFLAPAIIRGPGFPSRIALYGSENDGMTWGYVSLVARDATGFGRIAYPNLLLLPNGRLLFFGLNVWGKGYFIGMAESDDGGYGWSELRPIVAWGQSPWIARRKRGVYEGPHTYRSPWPLLLKDGRILVLFARRNGPYGIGGMVSEDEGASWSQEFIIRDDGSCYDLGYEVATQLDDGRIFTAYYFTVEDGNKFGGSRFIGGSFFRVK